MTRQMRVHIELDVFDVNTTEEAVAKARDILATWMAKGTQLVWHVDVLDGGPMFEVDEEEIADRVERWKSVAFRKAALGAVLSLGHGIAALGEWHRANGGDVGYWPNNPVSSRPKARTP